MASGSIEKLAGKQRYRVRIELGTDEAGKRIRRSEVVSGTRDAAQSRLIELLRQLDTGTYIEPSDESFGAFLDRWLEVAKPRLKDNSYRAYLSLIRCHAKPNLGSLPLVKVSAIALQELYAKLLAKKVGPTPIRQLHGVLHSALKQAVEWRLLPYNPARDVRKPRVKRRQHVVFGPDFSARILEAAGKVKHGIVFVFAMVSGMRPQEYLALQWSDLDLKAGEVQVKRALIRTCGGGWTFDDPKTPKSRRSVVLPATFIPMLRAHKARQAEARLRAGELWNNRDLVFCNDLGQPLHQRNLGARYFKEMLRQAELPATIRPYDLRHACATLLLEANENPKVVSERRGHSTTAMTMETYSHVTPTMQQRAAEKLDALVFGGAAGGTESQPHSFPA